MVLGCACPFKLRKERKIKEKEREGKDLGLRKADDMLGPLPLSLPHDLMSNACNHTKTFPCDLRELGDIPVDRQPT